jgi:hypothetical protein
MKYMSERTTFGNTGVSFESQILADLQAKNMDESGCIYCYNCADCVDCWSCYGCTGCVGSVKFVGVGVRTY